MDFEDEIDLVFEEYQVPQFDGPNDEFDSFASFEKVKSVFGINCEEEGIIKVITFLRSFNFLWIAVRNMQHRYISKNGGRRRCLLTDNL